MNPLLIIAFLMFVFGDDVVQGFGIILFFISILFC